MLLIRIFLIGLILLLTGNVASADRGEIKRLDIKYTAILKEIP